jgi:hypothetical protein
MRRRCGLARCTGGTGITLTAGDSLEAVAEGSAVSAFEAPLFSLALAGFYQVLEAPRALNRRLAAFGATAVPLHPQLVFPLPRHAQVRKLIHDSFSHVCLSAHKPANSINLSPV